MMISAKIFENEEDVKTFKKHAKYSSKSISYLKGVELELLGRLDWNVDHSSTLDFGLYYYANFLFRASDPIQTASLKGLEYKWSDFHTLLGTRLGLNASEVNFVKVVVDNQKMIHRASKVFVQVSGIDSSDLEAVSSEILKDYKAVVRGLSLRLAFKSKLNLVLTVYVLVFLKQFHVGCAFTTFHFVKEYLCSSIRR